MREPGGRARALASLVRNEAVRVLSDAHLAPDPALVAEGWERRFVTDATRVEEVVRLYRDLGYEVRLEPLATTDLEECCESCRLASALQFQTIYTRRSG